MKGKSDLPSVTCIYYCQILVEQNPIGNRDRERKMNKSGSPRNVLDYFNSPPAGLNKSDMFDVWLTVLKTSVDFSLPQCSESLNHRPPFPFEPCLPMAVKIMESGIFHAGGLKGALLGGERYDS
jgi:hypothetical protein